MSVIVPASNGLCFIIDEAEVDWVSKETWTISKTGTKYYVTNAQGEYLHRLILGVTPDQLVDHKNGVTVDCRRDNLRPCTPTQNAQNMVRKHTNQAGFKGVSRHQNGRFQARIRANGKRISIGYYDTPEEAAIAYSTASRNFHGEFAKYDLPLAS